MKSFCRLILLIICFLSSFSSFTQDTNKKQLQEDYSKYFKHVRETVYLHLNKTTFFVGEEVWWTAYAYNKKSNEPSFGTTNLYCGLYDRKGKQVKKELFLMEKGVGHGSFTIDSTFTSGTYYIKGGTTWMKNFEEDDHFVHKINIINKTIIPKLNTTTTFDLQILPEGGHLISNTDNMVGVRLTNENGKGIQIDKAEVLDNENSVVTSFYTNRYGVGRFKLRIQPNKTYRLKLNSKDGQVLEKSLPPIKPRGIAMAINNIIDDKLVVSLNTNLETLKGVSRDIFHLAIHRDGLMKLNSFNLDSISKTIKIDKHKLLPGTNIITLFNKDLEPISERLIFNYHKTNLATASLNKPFKKKKDSISIKINVFSKNNTPMSLSVSALPITSIANNSNTSIISDFLLQPYLKSVVENPARYFTEITRIKEYELDLILLTQGWSRYNWDMIFEEIPKIDHPFEFGIKAVGQVNSKMRKGEVLALVQNSITPMLFLELKDSINFAVTDLLLENGDAMKFSIKKKRGGLRKPNLDLDFVGFNSIEDSIALLKRNSLSFNFNSPSKNNAHQNVFLIQPEDLITLDEVVLTEEKIENQLTRKSSLIDSSFRGVKIDEKELRRSPLLTDLIARNGFRVIVNPRGDGEVLITNMKPILGPVRVYENDIPVLDPTQLLNIPLNQIDEVYFETDGMAADINATGGVIRIYRKEGPSARLSTSRFAEKLVENSFTKSKEFYRPKYTSPINQNFIDFGIVHWEPQLSTNNKGETILTIPDDKLPAVKLFIEGMAEDGSLLSQTHEISLN
ncbi:hypothetical protein DKG77_05920 [Flagellimonas aquimarina]|uniref:TonB-dependent receptor plug domain-containing protein n=1 Tax=Flagellimonas aquimarina TaxID=2201895 RepID=A0A316L2T2_9FLAO|nr:hypothetical protein [Allomuricauda koreensis]PWL40354.1 hypothetical protein DKG77_05920 [Allomuricauda koreensis]